MSQSTLLFESAPATPLVQRRLEQFQRDNARVIARFFGPFEQGSLRAVDAIGRFLEFDPAQRQREWSLVQRRFAARHRDLMQVLQEHFRRSLVVLDDTGHHDLVEQLRALGQTDQLLVGAYCTSEYAVEAAAFFNPSIVPHPCQNDVEVGSLRFIMSFRATGEGHISSVAFRSGIVDAQSRIRLDPVSPFISTPIVETNLQYDKALFAKKLQEIKAWNAVAGAVVALLPEQFTRKELEQAIASLGPAFDNAERENATRALRWLAESNYTIAFHDQDELCERIIFPVASSEAHGIEDARFVRFVEDDGSVCYYATYTAFSGYTTSVQLIQTRDFRTFDILTLNGPGVRDKGMALFPRKINGDYVMLGRQDGRNITLSRSRHLHFWYEWTPIIQPREPWELIKVGNCGSPIETPAGWLVLTHGVGAVRRYCIGVSLLDLQDPSHVIGRLKRPLIEPLESEREGYVPNVVYTCGALLHNGMLLIPYAMSDTRSGIASAKLDVLIEHILADGP